jgi:hypothetical protein
MEATELDSLTCTTGERVGHEVPVVAMEFHSFSDTGIRSGRPVSTVALLVVILIVDGRQVTFDDFRHMRVERLVEQSRLNNRLATSHSRRLHFSSPSRSRNLAPHVGTGFVAPNSPR